MKWTITDSPADLFEWAQIKRRLMLTDDLRKDTAMEVAAECVAYAEEKLETSLMEREITATFWVDDDVFLPRGPASEITSVTDSNNTALSYRHEVVGNSDRIVLTSSVGEYPVRVVYTAGYSSASVVPADIKGAILSHVQTKWLYPEAKTPSNVNVTFNLDDFYRGRSRGKSVY